MNLFRPNRSLAVMLLAASVAACGTTEPQESDPAIASVSGDNQSAAGGVQLADPLVVRVTRDGNALSGQAVNWSVTAGGGSVSPTTSTTDATGQASTTWTLGQAAGTNTAQAAGTGFTGSPVSFTAEALDPAPQQAAVSVEDNSFDPTSARVAQGGSVTWTWAGNNPHNVTFTSGTPSATQSTGTFVQSFPNTGSFDYTCTIHGAAMSGTIVVE